MKSLAVGLLLLVVQGCANAPVNDRTAEKAYQAIENRLLSAAVLRVDYEIEAKGAVVADLSGDLVMQTPTLAAIDANGYFGGADIAPVLVSNGTKMRGGVAPEYFEKDYPSDLRGGLLVGLLRMGILHSLANLSQGMAPDGTDGRVREWVVAKGFGWQSSTRSSGTATLRGISFALEVGGEPAGDVVLWYDPETGFPVEREQVVHFETGDMVVSERYSVVVDGVIGPCRFDMDSVPIVLD